MTFKISPRLLPFVHSITEIIEWNWTYRQFLEVARERYLQGDRHKQAHRNIADYFSGEYHDKYGKERDIPAQPHAYSAVALNLRKLDRLPVALLEARDFKRLRSILGDLKFVQAKCMAGMGYELLAEATRAVSCSVDEQADSQVSSNKTFFDLPISQPIS